MTDLLTIDELAIQVSKDARRVQQLRKALYWLDQADEAETEIGGSVTVRHDWANGVSGADEASAELARHYEKLYPQAIALVREMCRHELERINARYLPLLMPVSQGGEG